MSFVPPSVFFLARGGRSGGPHGWGHKRGPQVGAQAGAQTRAPHMGGGVRGAQAGALRCPPREANRIDGPAATSDDPLYVFHACVCLSCNMPVCLRGCVSSLVYMCCGPFSHRGPRRARRGSVQQAYPRPLRFAPAPPVPLPCRPRPLPFVWSAGGSARGASDARGSCECGRKARARSQRACLSSR